MEEIAATFRAVGLPPEPMMGAAALYRLVNGAALDEASEALHQGQPVSGLRELLAAYATGSRTRA
jgi:hypothetical protein